MDKSDEYPTKETIADLQARVFDRLKAGYASAGPETADGALCDLFLRGDPATQRAVVAALIQVIEDPDLERTHAIRQTGFDSGPLGIKSNEIPEA